MCIVALSVPRGNSGQILILMNRDEYFHRPATPVFLWENNPQILAGRDEPSLGTWLAVSKNKKFGVLTNYRNFFDQSKYSKSRGEIIVNYLRSSLGAKEFIAELSVSDKEYKGFNLILGDENEIFFYSKITKEIIPLIKGTYILSNGSLDTPWPKVTKLRILFTQELIAYQNSPEKNKKLIETFFSIMQDKEVFPDDQLPSTGADLETERFLSSIFLKHALYGTRSTSFIRLFNERKSCTFIERTYTLQGFFDTEKQF
ncbi:MAG: NRDE family protein [Silvanigrellaceae bacterium]|nr:NRDE family protein [Silvanigrellaceae bacterium]